MSNQILYFEGKGTIGENQIVVTAYGINGTFVHKPECGQALLLIS